MHFARPGCWLRSVLLLLALVAVPTSGGQPPGASEDALGEAGPTGVIDEIELRVVRFGPGNEAREGSYVGVLVQLRDNGTLNGRDVLLRINGVDLDGDPIQHGRVVSTQPQGAPGTAWLYLRTPMSSARVSTLRLEAYSVLEDDQSSLGVRPDRLLGSLPVALQPVIVPRTSGMFGVIGPRSMGLAKYSTQYGTEAHSPLGHERIEVSTSLSLANDLPDRWQGLQQLSVLVWGPATDASPGLLSPEQARSVREWVERGGHLVVVLPPVGQDWLSATTNPLAGIMPDWGRVERSEGVDLGRYRPLLTRRVDVPLPSNATVHAFEPPRDANPQHAIPVLAGPDGETIVLRRIVGSGLVTVVGLDLGSATLDRAGLPDPERFWHRILGQRGELRTRDELRNDPQYGRNADGILSGVTQRRPRVFDDEILSLIDQSRSATVGVLLGLVLFILYWLVAGPVGYAILKSKGLEKHAWVAYLATAGVFTAAAWIGAESIRPRTPRAEFVAIVDQVYGQPTQRARVFASVLIPRYGDATIAVGDIEPGQEAAIRTGREGSDLLSPFDPPDDTAGSGGFPDNRTYTLDARAPRAMSVPARQTVKQVAAEWSGEPVLALPAPVQEAGDLEARRISWRVDGDETGRETFRISGQIEHGLPGPLEDATVLIIGPQRDLLGLGASVNLRRTEMFARPNYAITLDDPWGAGVPLDLGALLEAKRQSERNEGEFSAARWVRQLLPRGADRSGFGVAATASGRVDERLIAAGFLSQFEPPPLASNPNARETDVGRRTTLHGLDLGVWFTQPCVIVVGKLRQSSGALPIPMTLDGERFDAGGLTVVRWIYPMSPQPPGFPGGGGVVATEE